MDCLIGQEDIRVVVREAKADRRIELDADAMTKVVEITATQWRSIMAFAVGKKMVSPEELTALRIACQLPMKVPTPAQSRKLIVLLEKIYEEGFKL